MEMIRNKQDLFAKLNRDGIDISINTVSLELLTDKDIIIALASKRSPLIKEIPANFINNEIAMLIINKSISNFEYLPITLRQDKYFISNISFKNIESLSVIKFSGDVILSDKNFILTLIEKIGIDATRKYDSLFNLHSSNETLYKFLSDNLKADLEIIAKFSKYSSIFEFVPIELRDDLSFSEQYINDNLDNLEYAGPKIKSDRNLIKNYLSKRGDIIKYVKDYFYNDVELAGIAVKNNGLSLEYFSEEIQNNFEIVNTAILENPFSLEFASSQLKDNLNIVLTAIENNGFALEFASEKYRDDEDIVSKAISYKRNEELGWGGWGELLRKKSSGGAFKFASERIKCITELSIIALKNEGVYGTPNSWGTFDHESEKPLFAYLSENVKNDKNVVLIAIENNLDCIQYINPILKDTPEIKLLISNINEKKAKN